VVAQGGKPYVINNLGVPALSNGTSFSTPIVAGAAACLWQGLSHLNNFEIQTRIEQSAHQYCDPDSLLGYGIPNFEWAYKGLNTCLFGELDNNELRIFPNPVAGNSNNTVNFVFNTDQEGEYEVSIYSVNGSLMASQIKEVQEGFTQVSFDRIAQKKWASGVYLVKIEQINNEATNLIFGKFVKVDR
ncbi:MAG: S8 family peptidase, partial [Flavobacteriales bacterium]|nr:S8 family peptidase [Flavobacteriales bacterium]